jgi:nucleoside-triphosphatase THEP1
MTVSAAGRGDPTKTREADAPRSRLVVLTGLPGAGKTTRCRQLVRDARDAGLVVRGVVTADACGTAGVERWLEDLRSGERVLLGRKAQPGETVAGSPLWMLEDSALERCNEILRDACPTDLLVIDEVGPVELLQRRGSLTGVCHALSGPYVAAVVVVRPWLVPRFRELLPDPSTEVVDVRDSGGLAELVASVAAGERM